MSSLTDMKKIEIPRITRVMRFSDFHKSFADLEVEIWVNLPPKMRLAYADFQDRNREKAQAFRQYQRVLEKTNDEDERAKIDADIEKLSEEIKALNDEIYGWYGEVWGQPTEDVREFAKYCIDNGLDGMWEFAKDKTWSLITMHLKGFEKN